MALNMNWLNRWFAKKCKEAWEYNSSQPDCKLTGSIAVDDTRLSSQGMNFTVYRANGGHVIEHRVYDRKTDRNNNSLHVITDDKDLGEEIGKIITFENLRS